MKYSQNRRGDGFTTQRATPAHHDHFTASDAKPINFLMPFADDSFGPSQAQEHAQISPAQQD
ncbi:MAG TPA: hypothetical protein VMR98_03995, partial [Candidatus Polarisedimenticolaceae bacterium]|nr:hypothetical protein [Candidatus Polarisedimenticolaceae bacterium]